MPAIGLIAHTTDTTAIYPIAPSSISTAVMSHAIDLRMMLTELSTVLTVTPKESPSEEGRMIGISGGTVAGCPDRATRSRGEHHGSHRRGRHPAGEDCRSPRQYPNPGSRC